MLEASFCPAWVLIHMIIERYQSGRATRRIWTNRCAGVNLQFTRPERRVGGCQAAVNPAYFFVE